MKTKFIKIATIVALGAVSFLSSCNKEELEVESQAVNTLEADSFHDLLDEIKNDTNVISFSLIDLNETNKDLRKGIDAYNLGRLYLSDLIIYSKSSKPVGDIHTPNGDYKQIDVDLNMGAGGDYVYLYYKTTSDPKYAVSYIDGYYNRTSYREGGIMVIDLATGTIADCNKGTKGGKIALGIRKDNSRHINKIAVVAYRKPKSNHFLGLQKVADGLDLNKGAGGQYIYIYADWK